jgi:8-oxo-dGTP diphosphatase
MTFDSPAVWAAGAVLLRGSDDAREVAIVHRPRYDDWTLPKGKANPTELLPLTAVREVAEETGALIRLGPALTALRYFIPGGLKYVSYWRGATLALSQRTPDDEVDEVAWLPLERAYDVMTWNDEAGLVGEAAALPETTPHIIVRHAQAVARRKWTGPDRRRPLDDRGRLQIAYLNQILQSYGVTRLVSSPAARCLQTVEAHARRDQAPITEEPLISEEGAAGHEAEVAAYIARLARTVGATGAPTAVCSHRPVVDALLSGLGLPAQPLATGAYLVAHVDRTGATAAVERGETVRVKTP